MKKPIIHFGKLLQDWRETFSPPVWQEMRNPERLRFLLLALFILAMAITTWQAWPSFYETEQKQVTGGSDYLPYRLREGDVLIQDIRPTRDGLTQLTLSFDTPDDQVLLEESQMLIQIYSAETMKADPELVDEVILDGTNLMLFARTEIPVSLNRQTADHTYSIKLTVSKLDSRSRLSIHTAHLSGAGMSFNGRPTGLAAIMLLTYRTFNWPLFLVAVLLLSLIFLLLFVPTSRLDALLSRRAILPLLTAPFLTLATVELLNTLNTDVFLSAPIILVSLTTVLLLEFVLCNLTGDIRLAIIANHILFVALGVANHMKLFFRGDPFVAGDLLSLAETAHTINQLRYIISNRFLLALFLTIVFLLLAWKVNHRTSNLRRRVMAGTAAVTALTVLLGGLILSPNRLQLVLDITRYPWNQMVNYNRNGVILPFLQSTRNLNAAIPVRTNEITPELYLIPAAERRDQASPEKPNIIAIMSESFCDFDNIRPIETSEPATPFFDVLMNSPNTRHGNLLVSIFGGGTCNTEFEFLTGSSMLFMADGSLPYNSYFNGKSHALPDLLGQQGYRSVAIHPFLRTFWDRNLVYPAMGFDQYISLEDFQEGGLVRDFVGDQADFARIMDTLENKRPNERLFIFSVTMQNHFPYYSSEEILAGLDYNIKLPQMTEVESVESVELYLSLLRQSDDALRELVYYLASVDEPTMLVLFGDHLPGNNNSFKSFYENLFSKNLSDLTLSETEKLYQTPWLIWANYNLPEVDDQVTSPNFLGTTVLDLAGAAKSPYFERVSALNQTVKAMSNKMVVMQDDRIYSRERIPSGLVRQLDRYWAAEYDNIILGKDQ